MSTFPRKVFSLWTCESHQHLTPIILEKKKVFFCSITGSFSLSANQSTLPVIIAALCLGLSGKLEYSSVTLSFLESQSRAPLAAELVPWQGWCFQFIILNSTNSEFCLKKWVSVEVIRRRCEWNHLASDKVAMLPSTAEHPIENELFTIFIGG